MAVLTIAFDRGIFGGAVHVFNLPVGLGMFGLGKPMLHTVLVADLVEAMNAVVRLTMQQHTDLI